MPIILILQGYSNRNRDISGRDRYKIYKSGRFALHTKGSAGPAKAFLFEHRCEKTGLRGFRPGPTQTRLYNHTRWLEAGNFVFRKKRDRTIRLAKTKTLISFAVTAKLICIFVFAYAKSRFSHDEAQLVFVKLLFCGHCFCYE